MVYIGVYCCLVVSTLLVETLLWKHKTRKLLENLLCGFFVFLVLALKGTSVGNDTQTYFEIYEWTKITAWSDIGSYYTSIETGFKILFKIFSFCGLPYSLFSAFLYSFICFSFGFFFSKYSATPGLCWCVFFSLGEFTFVASGIRQTFALSLSLLGLSIFSLSSKKWWTWPLSALITLLIAPLFHSSAILFSVIYLGFFLNFNKPSGFLLIFVIATLLLIFGYPLLSLYVYKLNNNAEVGSYAQFYTAQIGGTSVLYAVAILLFCVLSFLPRTTATHPQRGGLIEALSERAPAESKIKNGHSLLLWGCALALFVRLLGSFNSMATRLAVYFDIFYCPLLPVMLVKIKKAPTKLVFLSLFLACLPLYFYYTTLRTNYLGLLPYRFFWQ